LFKGQLTLVLCKPNNNNNLAASLWEAGPGSGLVTVGGQLCFVVIRSLAGGLYAEVLVVAVLLVEGQRSAADRSARVQPACLLSTDWLRPGWNGTAPCTVYVGAARPTQVVRVEMVECL
jgi:hypothetical protein